MIETHLIETILIGKVLLLLGWLFFLYKTARTGDVRWALFGILYIGAFSISFEMLTSRVGYSLPCDDCDAAAYVGQAMTYAVGNPFGEDFAYQGIPSMYSPVYPYIVAIVYWITGFNVIRIYDYGSTIAVLILALLFFYFGCPRDPLNPPKTKEIQWTGALMAFSVLYMSTDPVKWKDNYEAIWNTFILLKPGHVLSLFFLPILYFYITKQIKWHYMLLAGVALGAMLTTFIVSAIFISGGLIAYLMLIYLLDKTNFPKETFKIIIVTIIAAIFSSWYWLPIFTHGFKLGGDLVAGSIPTIYSYSANVVFDPFEATFFMLPLFWLGIIGIVVMLNRRRKGDLLILGLIVALYSGKLIYPVLWKLFNFAPQAWESSIFYLRPAMAMAASIGVYAITEYILKNYEKIKEYFLNQPFFAFLGETIRKVIASRWILNREGTVIACCLLILTPYATPVWHNPILNSWWGGKIPPLPGEVVDYSNWIKENTPKNAVILSDGITSMRISTYTGRKLMKDLQGLNAIVNFHQRLNDAKTIMTSQVVDNETKSVLKNYNIGYIMITNDTKVEYPNIGLDKFYNNELFSVIYKENNILIFKVERDRL